MSRWRDRVARVPRRVWVIAAIVLAFAFGLWLGGDGDPAPRDAGSDAAAKAQWYTCSMHPQVRLRDPNALCPICGMELIPVPLDDDGGDSATPRRLSMSEAARRLAEVRTSKVERRHVIKEVRLTGKVDYDETRVRAITARVSGRLDRLYVDYTGVAVAPGAPLVWMYSPELLVAQEGLLKADRALAEMTAAGAADENVEMQRSTVKALEDRLRLWGLADEQIQEVRTRGATSDHMKILSPISGIVIGKESVEGGYVQVGQTIYRIADLSRVWVYLDAYESDLAWVRYAQEVEFEAEADPGRTFHGRVSFIDPFLNQRTRTVKVRVTVENEDGRLKPGMFVRARVHARLADGGRIVEPSLAGKWISPVHPEIVRDEPGDCPICGTPLVSADSLGYVAESARAPLVVPATAPLRTGRRAVVYVRVPDADRPTYDGREVVLGPRAQNDYLVESGLEEGEEVVTHGAFKIDSALQIRAKPSMMSPPDEGASEEAHVHPDSGPDLPEPPAAFRDGLAAIARAYLAVGEALAADDLPGAQERAAAITDAVAATSSEGLDGPSLERWSAHASALRDQGAAIVAAAEIEAARRPFALLSETLAQTLAAFGHAGLDDLRLVKCPMAFSNRGARWIQRGDEIVNPYFGAAMLRCGDVIRPLPRRPGE